MQVFIIGTPLATAMALSKRHLKNQINEANIILDALNGAKAWSNHPCVLQYRGYEKWLWMYKEVLYEYYKIISDDDETYSMKADRYNLAIFWNKKADTIRPLFHTQEYFDQMKRRLYTKDPEQYNQWEDLGTSDCNWYWSQEHGEWRKYVNGKRVE